MLQYLNSLFQVSIQVSSSSGSVVLYRHLRVASTPSNPARSELSTALASTCHTACSSIPFGRSTRFSTSVLGRSTRFSGFRLLQRLPSILQRRINPLNREPMFRIVRLMIDLTNVFGFASVSGAEISSAQETGLDDLVCVPYSFFLPVGHLSAD